jgi:hypothetical protein
MTQLLCPVWCIAKSHDPGARVALDQGSRGSKTDYPAANNAIVVDHRCFWPG